MAMTNQTFGEVATEIKNRGGSIAEQADKWRTELEAAMLEVPAPAPAEPEAEEEPEIEDMHVVDGTAMLSKWKGKASTFGSKYISLKKLQELEAADPTFALKWTGGSFSKTSKFLRDVKVAGVIQYEKDAKGEAIYDTNKEGVKVPRKIQEKYEEEYLETVDRKGVKYLFNAGLGFQLEFPAFCEKNGQSAWFRAKSDGSVMAKNYKVTITKA